MSSTFTVHFEVEDIHLSKVSGLVDRVFALLSSIDGIANEPMQVHHDTCDQCEHCAYTEDEA